MDRNWKTLGISERWKSYKNIVKISKIQRKYIKKLYNKKISRIDDKLIEYKPSPNLLDCLIKYDKKKNNI